MVQIKDNSEKYTVNNIDAKEEIEKEKMSFLEKIKRTEFYRNIKKTNGIKLILPIVLLVIVFSVYYSLFKNDSDTTKDKGVSYTSSMQYCKELEDKLCKVLGNVKGAGNVNVMVTLESGPELKIATQVDEKTNTTTNSSGTTTSVTIVEEPIIVTQNGEEQPLVLMEILPVIKGIVVVAEGAKDVNVRLNLLEAVQALLGLNSSNIQILTGI